MRSQTLIIITLALACGGFAALGVYLFSGKGHGTTAIETIVLMAADVPRGETIKAESLVLLPYPKDLVPPGVLRKAEDAIGRAALIPLVKDEPVLDAKLASKGAGRGMASLIKKGMRAITVQTPNVATGVAGFIVPGNHVDVLLSLNNSGPDDKDNLGAITLLEDVEILAVDQKVDAPAENRVDAGQMRSVTLSVTPEQATRLTLGQSKGTIHISLRNTTDNARAGSPAVRDLRGSDHWSDRIRKTFASMNRPTAQTRPTPPAATPPPKPVAAPIRKIRTFRGSREGVIHFEAASTK